MLDIVSNCTDEPKKLVCCFGLTTINELVYHLADDSISKESLRVKVSGQMGNGSDSMLVLWDYQVGTPGRTTWLFLLRRKDALKLGLKNIEKCMHEGLGLSTPRIRRKFWHQSLECICEADAGTAVLRLVKCLRDNKLRNELQFILALGCQVGNGFLNPRSVTNDRVLNQNAHRFFYSPTHLSNRTGKESLLGYGNIVRHVLDLHHSLRPTAS